MTNPDTHSCFYDGDTCVAETWEYEGELHRLDGPARIERWGDGSIKSEMWCKYGKQHREDGPAYVEYTQDRIIELEEWRIEGELHAEDGPARIEYIDSRGYGRELWYAFGELHREDGPAIKCVDARGRIVHQSWYVRDKLHRVGAPASITTNPVCRGVGKGWYTEHAPNGAAVYEGWYELGVQKVRPEGYKPSYLADMKKFFTSTKIDRNIHASTPHTQDKKMMVSYSVKPNFSVYFIYGAPSGDYLVEGATSKEHAADILFEDDFVEAKIEEMKSEIISRAEYEDIDTEKAIANISVEECKKLVLDDIYDSIYVMTHEEIVEHLESAHSDSIHGVSIRASDL